MSLTTHEAIRNEAKKWLKIKQLHVKEEEEAKK